MTNPTKSASRARPSSSSRRRETGPQDVVSGAGGGVPKRRGRPPRAPGSAVHRPQREQIRYIEASNLVQAIHHAATIGQQINFHLTVHWRFADSGLPVPERQRRLLNKLGIWLKRKTGKSAAWVYARETGKVKGEHLHLAVHFPPKLEPAFEAYAKTVVGHDARREAVVKIDRAVVVTGPFTPDELHLNLKSYLLKEGDDRTRTQWVIQKPHLDCKRNGGTIEGKRVGVSHAIGRAARSAHVAGLAAEAEEMAKPPIKERLPQPKMPRQAAQEGQEGMKERLANLVAQTIKRPS